MADPSPATAQTLSFLVGRLAGPETMHATAWAPAGAATGSVEGRLELGGTVLVQHQTQEREGGTGFSAVNVFMVDPATGEVLLYGFDSVGFPPDPPARGTWQDGRLVLLRSSERGSSRATYIPTENGFRWEKEFRAPGTDAWLPVVEGQMYRAAGA